MKKKYVACLSKTPKINNSNLEFLGSLKKFLKVSRSVEDEKRDNSYWLFGFHAVMSALANPLRRIRALICSPETAEKLLILLSKLPDSRYKTLPKPKLGTIKEISAIVGQHVVHQGIVAWVDSLRSVNLDEALTTSSKQRLLIVLDQVTDPQNLGAVLRSSAAFGADAVIVQDRYTAKATALVAKIASGALDVIPLVRVNNLARALRKIKEVGFYCVGFDEKGSVELEDLHWCEKVALILGSEEAGLRRLTRETCNQLAYLPTKAPIRSLNVSAVAAIALHHFASSFRRVDKISSKL
ncbi:RNA 2'-O ribose methyltransferase substrate binding family protein [Candidatus Endolissoclinum faulkneri L2]|uniref:RNA 2'-O ribose methyltransferase substrate binding family protein n=1 Tax=Candidatus Endolissoclinum faulkneri L2 TaxID=1193729 RepID=K7YLV6_9PROT|nr:23S rRNA (guanosine(2251)-2'-O)-methyltransferase RlmB [Candidatus Endolissoclinum faulkneri]AFX98452.1 RNA 2'-O ribose methyltransferase substrate binding family protein [Candidatus Endolissoclinum faulkneri L2]